MDNERRVSYTQYSTWLNCPLQWKLTNIDKLKPPDISIHLVFGTSMHHALQEWLTVLFTKEPHKAKILDVDSIFKDKLIEEFTKQTYLDVQGNKVFPCDKGMFTEFYMDGCAIIDYVKKHQKTLFPTVGHELLGCEIPLRMEVAPNIDYLGYIDIVILNTKADTIKIYDLKTSGKGWNYEKKDPKKLNQLLLYKHFYAKLYDVDIDKIEIEFTILKRKLNSTNKWDKRVSSFEPPNGKSSIKKAVDSFELFLHSTFDENGQPRENIQPTPSKSACRFCLFNQTEHCKVGAWKG